MPEFIPFKGSLYADTANLDKLICPPYDVISPEERIYYANLSPYNAVHIELPEPSNPHRYKQAGNLLVSWLETGILVTEEAPIFYGYEMQPKDSQLTKTTIGVLGAIKLEDPGEGIFPHEKTIQKDMTDRLELLKATKANISPIWLLSKAKSLSALVRSTKRDLIKAVSKDLVIHSYWKIKNSDAIKEIARLVSLNDLVIADGHHRFATALNFYKSLGEPKKHPSQYVMAYVVQLDTDSLDLGPIHRVVSKDLGQALINFCQRFNFIKKLTLQQAFSLELQRDSFAVALGNEINLYQSNELAQKLPSEFAEELLNLLKGEILCYANNLDEVKKALVDKKAVLCLPAVTVKDIDYYSTMRKVMPPKSTFFRPKPQTGMVIRCFNELPKLPKNDKAHSGHQPL